MNAKLRVIVNQLSESQGSAVYVSFSQPEQPPLPLLVPVLTAFSGMLSVPNPVLASCANFSA